MKRFLPAWRSGTVLTRKDILPVLAYAAAIAGLLVVAGLSLAGLRGDHADYVEAADMLDRIEGRKPPDGASPASAPLETPFLEGPSLTVAGAALQQRVVAAVGAAGGSVLSSQIELQKADAKPGFVSLSASCEVDPAMLQQLLYDLEAGMPFLFVDQIQAQAPQSDDGAAGGRSGGRLRVQIDVSGQWRMTNKAAP